MRVYDLGCADRCGLSDLWTDSVQKVRPRPDEALLYQRELQGLFAPEEKRGYKRRMPKATTETVENAEALVPAEEPEEKKPAGKKSAAKKTATKKSAASKAEKPAAKPAKTKKKAEKAE